MIAFLAAISMRRLETFERAVNEIELPEFKIPEIELPDLRLDELDLESLDLEGLNLEGLGLEGFGLDKPEKPLTIEEIKQNYKTFISPDKTIQMKYPSHWQEIDPVFLEKISQEMKELGLEQNEILFFAYQKRLIEFPPILTVVSMPPEMGLEQVIKETKRIAKEQEFEIEIIKKGFKNNKAYGEEDKSSSLPFADAQVFEVKYTKEFQVLILKGKIVFFEKRNYLISILIPSELQEEMSPEIDFIFDSIINIQSP